MKTFLWIFGILSTGFELSSSADVLIDCSFIQKPIIHPRECCSYPISWVNDTTTNKCIKDCPDIKRSEEYKSENDYERDKCCLMRCLYSVQRILWQDRERNDGVPRIDVKMLKESFRKTQNNRLSEEWTEIVGKSIDKCMEMYPPVFSTGHCLPLYFLNTMVCIYRENFLNCPIYEKSLERCRQLSQSVEYCKENTEVTIKDWDKFFF